MLQECTDLTVWEIAPHISLCHMKRPGFLDFADSELYFSPLGSFSLPWSPSSSSLRLSVWDWRRLSSAIFCFQFTTKYPCAFLIAGTSAAPCTRAPSSAAKNLSFPDSFELPLLLICCSHPPHLSVTLCPALARNTFPRPVSKQVCCLDCWSPLNRCGRHEAVV